MVAAIKNFIKYRSFLATVVARDIRKKYYRSSLGLLWTLLRPLMMTIVITIVFSTLFKRAVERFPLYFVTGHLVFDFMSGATTVSLHSILKNGGIIRKIYIPRYMFVISDLTVALINMGFSLIPMIGVVIYTGTKITWLWLFIPLVLAALFFFTLGLCLILSSYGVFFRDLDHLYGILTTVWMYFTPLFYPMSVIENSRFMFVWELNPMVSFVKIFRAIVYNVTLPSMNDVGIALIYSALTFTLGCVIFNENQDRFFLYM